MQIRLILTAVLIASCTSRPDKISWSELQKKLPPEPSCKINVKETIKVRGTLDGKGCIYFWKGKGAESCHGDEEVSETEPRMFEMEPGSTLRNVVIDCSPDGILMNDDTVIENIFVRDTGEDAVTTKGRNNTIRNSKFYRSDDKMFQLNRAENVRIQGNEFHYAKIALGGSANDQGAKPIEVSGNKFLNVKTVILAQANHDFRMGNNSAKNIECFFETKSKGIIRTEGSKQSIDGGELNCSRGTKNVK